jgi:(p)ppGpp synthase/HD superfamily hydrolase
MTGMSTLERAICIAAEAHAGQTDKAGAPYILHPLRVMGRVSSQEERIVAVLHDVIEDTDWTPDRLRAEGFSEIILDALDCVTHRPEEGYEDFVRRAAVHPVARQVKRADILDNMDPTRISEPTERDARRMEKYARALAILDEAQER